MPERLDRRQAAHDLLHDPAMQAQWAKSGGKIGDAVATFAALRAAKDSF